MEKTKDKLNLWQKIVEVRKTIPYIKKDGKGYGYDYAKESTLMGIIQDAMNEQGLILYQELRDLENVPMTIIAKDKSTKDVIGVKATFIYHWINASNPDERMYAQQVLQDYKSDVQGCGGLMTYGIRYFLLKFFNVATDKDDPDAFDRNIESFKRDKEEGISISPPAQEYISKDQIKEIQSMCNGKFEVLHACLRMVKLESLDELLVDKHQAFVEFLKKKLSNHGK